MKPASFRYLRPSTLDDAIACLHDPGEQTHLLAGGQSLLPRLNMRRQRPSVLVDLDAIASLRHLTVEGATLRIGAMTTHADIERARVPDVLPNHAALPQVARRIGYLPIRTRGTFGGSLANAEPDAEWCVLSVLLEAELVVYGSRGWRFVKANDFFIGKNHTMMGADEILVEVRFDRPARTATLRKFPVTEAGMSFVAAAAQIELAPDGTVSDARLAFGGVGDVPVRAVAAEFMLAGIVPTSTSITEVTRQAAAWLPLDDSHDARYRREIAATMATRACLSSMARAIVTLR